MYNSRILISNLSKSCRQFPKGLEFIQFQDFQELLKQYTERIMEKITNTHLEFLK